MTMGSGNPFVIDKQGIDLNNRKIVHCRGPHGHDGLVHLLVLIDDELIREELPIMNWASLLTINAFYLVLYYQYTCSSSFVEFVVKLYPYTRIMGLGP